MQDGSPGTTAAPFVADADEARRLRSELKAVINDHLDWLAGWHRAFLSRGAEASDGIAANHLPQQAHEGPGLCLGEGEAVRGLSELHAQMHEHARMLTHSAAAGAAPVSAYDAFMDSATRFVAEAQRLETLCLGTSAEVDTETGLPTQDALLRDLRHEHARVVRLGRPSSFALVALDGDSHGNGDDGAVAAVSRCLQGNLRPYDTVYRYEATTLAVCLPDTVAGVARSILNRLHGCIEGSSDRSDIATPSCRIAVATIDPHADAEACLREATAALAAEPSSGAA